MQTGPRRTALLAAALARLASSAGTAARSATLFGVIQTVGVVAGFVLLFRGTQHVLALALMGVVTLLRLCAERRYRQMVRERMARDWARCGEFAASRCGVPWLAASRLIALPVALWCMANYFEAYGDNAPVMQAAASLVREGNLNLDEYFEFPTFENMGVKGGYTAYTLRATEAGYFSNYPAGPVQFALPVAAVARLVGADLTRQNVQNRLSKFTAALTAGACAGLFFLIALQLASPRAAMVTVVLLSTGSALYSTVGQGLWQHGGIVVWSLVIVLIEFLRMRGSVKFGTLIQGFAIGMMLACRLTSVVVILPFGFWVLAREPRRAFVVAGISLLAYLPWAGLYWLIYGTPLGPSASLTSSFNWSIEALFENVSHVLFSPGRGLFVYQAFLVLAFAGLYLRKRGSEPAGWKVFASAAIVANLMMVSLWGMWYGGWCWGSRLMTDTLVLGALLCVKPIDHLCGSRAALVALAIAGFAVHAPVIFTGAMAWNGIPSPVEDDSSRLLDWSNAPFLFPLR